MAEKTEKRVILGTAGHIDHGKTTLVKALTGIDTDRLKEEKERGITIELGFAHLTLPSGIRLGIVDVPGHERFVKNMVAGASGIDLVALVVAADEGVMPQTREHLEICELLGVKTGLVVITKKDLVEEDWLELIKEDITEALKGTFLEGAPIIAVSATTGEGLDELIALLDELVKKVPARPAKGPFRLPVDRVFTIKGFGTVVTGTALSGRIKLGDEAMIYPRELSTRIRRIQVHGEDRDEALAGQRTALNLQGIEKEEVERGDVVAMPGTLRPSLILDVSLRYLSSASKPLLHNTRVRLHIGTSEVLGRVFLFGKDKIEPGEEALAQLRLEEPVVCWRGDHFVLRSYSPMVTIGGGVVLNPVAERRKRSQKRQVEELKFLKEAPLEEVILYHLKMAKEMGLPEEEIALRVSLFDEDLAKVLKRLKEYGKIKEIPFENKKLYLAREIYDQIKGEILNRLKKFHEKFPLKPGLTKEELRQRLPSGLDNRAFEKMLEELIAKNKVVQEEKFIRLSEHKIVLAEEQEAIKQKLENIFRKAGVTPPDKDEVIASFKENAPVAQEIFSLLLQEGKLVKLRDELIFHADVLEEVKNKVISFLKNNQEMAVGDFKKLLGGASRKYTIPLLEYLDHQKITIRVGDKRVLRKAT
ncbi:selenocysteine-specific translation elongation factor [Thermodesulfatator autotrophicus]|uniref:Selenocysteine-specific elongation factor n=1 Tax=Thermodesulfatator autotrophicus TaxID=1795632 RepID=A0A177E8Q1_9BACT|nr:selenocysteine-specific translation elongation factor [Thermodesulfatator autotrophicus]OAG28333.1 translation elongation factor [Thermodesulfatator autotrophicus]